MHRPLSTLYAHRTGEPLLTQCRSSPDVHHVEPAVPCDAILVFVTLDNQICDTDALEIIVTAAESADSIARLIGLALSFGLNPRAYTDSRVWIVTCAHHCVLWVQVMGIQDFPRMPSCCFLCKRGM